MKITVLSWKDERWSANKEALDSINKMIKKNKPPKVKWKRAWEPTNIFDKCALCVGWLAVSPFILAEVIELGFKWIIKKIKRK